MKAYFGTIPKLKGSKLQLQGSIEENFTREKKMEVENFNGLMDNTISETGRMGIGMEKVSGLTNEETVIMVNGSKEEDKGTESIYLKVDSTMEIFWTSRKMDGGGKNWKMEIIMKEVLRKGCLREKELISGQMERNIKGSFCTVSETEKGF